jgi:hypothetical protein
MPAQVANRNVEEPTTTAFTISELIGRLMRLGLAAQAEEIASVGQRELYHGQRDRR